MHEHSIPDLQCAKIDGGALRFCPFSLPMSHVAAAAFAPLIVVPLRENILYSPGFFFPVQAFTWFLDISTDMVGSFTKTFPVAGVALARCFGAATCLPFCLRFFLSVMAIKLSSSLLASSGDLAFEFGIGTRAVLASRAATGSTGSEAATGCTGVLHPESTESAMECQRTKPSLIRKLAAGRMPQPELQCGSWRTTSTCGGCSLSRGDARGVGDAIGVGVAKGEIRRFGVPSPIAPLGC